MEKLERSLQPITTQSSLFELKRRSLENNQKQHPKVHSILAKRITNTVNIGKELSLPEKLRLKVISNIGLHFRNQRDIEIMESYAVGLKNLKSLVRLNLSFSPCVNIN